MWGIRGAVCAYNRVKREATKAYVPWSFHLSPSTWSAPLQTPGMHTRVIQFSMKELTGSVGGAIKRLKCNGLWWQKVIKILDTDLHSALQCHAMPISDVVG